MAQFKSSGHVLDIPEEPDCLDTDVALLPIRGTNLFIDVSWYDPCRRYYVRVFEGFYDNELFTVECDTASDVIETVNDILAKQEGSLLRSASPVQDDDVFEATCCNA